MSFKVNLSDTFPKENESMFVTLNRNQVMRGFWDSHNNNSDLNLLSSGKAVFGHFDDKVIICFLKCIDTKDRIPIKLQAPLTYELVV